MSATETSGNQHQRVLMDAEVHHLAGILATHRVLHHDAFKEIAGASAWRESSFDCALAAAVEAGVIERLPGDFYRTPGFGDEPEDAAA